METRSPGTNKRGSFADNTSGERILASNARIRLGVAQGQPNWYGSLVQSVSADW
jgi:hypothetical protein